MSPSDGDTTLRPAPHRCPRARARSTRHARVPGMAACPSPGTLAYSAHRSAVTQARPSRRPQDQFQEQRSQSCCRRPWTVTLPPSSSSIQPSPARDATPGPSPSRQAREGSSLTIEHCHRLGSRDGSASPINRSIHSISIRALVIGVIAFTVGTLAAIIATFTTSTGSLGVFSPHLGSVVGLAAGAVAWIVVSLSVASTLNRLVQ